jgi:hypothetical protein
MSKYKCMCGYKYNAKETADLHMFMNPGHVILEMSWKTRFWDWFWSYPWSRVFRFIGATIVYLVLCHHFNISWTMWEAILLGVGAGMYIE